MYFEMDPVSSSQVLISCCTQNVSGTSANVFIDAFILVG